MWKKSEEGKLVNLDYAVKIGMVKNDLEGWMLVATLHNNDECIMQDGHETKYDAHNALIKLHKELIEEAVDKYSERRLKSIRRITYPS